MKDGCFSLSFRRGQKQTQQKIDNLSTIYFEKYICNEFMESKYDIFRKNSEGKK
jgi:hypothetical protein